MGHIELSKSIKWELKKSLYTRGTAGLRPSLLFLCEFNK